MPDDSRKAKDLEIVRSVLEGEVDSFEHLVTSYKQDVMNIVVKHLPYDRAEETAQEVFIRAYQSLGTFKGESSFKTWLATITARTCFDFWRKHYRSREIPMSSLTEKHTDWLEGIIAEQADQSLEDKGFQEEAQQLLDWALNRLSPEDRMVLELVHLEGYSVKEAAALLGWTAVNVKVRAFRSRRKLHRLLTEAKPEQVENRHGN